MGRGWHLTLTETGNSSLLKATSSASYIFMYLSKWPASAQRQKRSVHDDGDALKTSPLQFSLACRHVHPKWKKKFHRITLIGPINIFQEFACNHALKSFPFQVSNGIQGGCWTFTEWCLRIKWYTPRRDGMMKDVAINVEFPKGDPPVYLYRELINKIHLWTRIKFRVRLK